MGREYHTDHDGTDSTGDTHAHHHGATKIGAGRLRAVARGIVAETVESDRSGPLHGLGR